VPQIAAITGKGGKQRRFDLGDGTVLPEEARRRGQRVKDLARQGLDPTGAIVEMKTGVSVKLQREEAERRGPPSIEWAEARTWFLEEFVRAKRSIDTYDSYRKELLTPELSVFDGRMVADITKEDVAEVLKKIAKRGAESLAEHVQRALSSSRRHCQPSGFRRPNSAANRLASALTRSASLPATASSAMRLTAATSSEVS
jgi:hypothetical protein